MPIEAAVICELTEMIWATMLGLQTSPSPRPDGAAAWEDCLTACVQITGAWDGAVTLECSAALARQAAGILFGVPPEETTPAQVHDTLGELANITGGNLKGFLEGPCYLCLPTVVVGSDYRHLILESKLVARVAFSCAGQPFQVTVLEQDAARRARARSAAGRGRPLGQ